MKKAYLLLLGCLALAGCEKQLDIVPKGQTTLDNIVDLEYLLNQDYALGEAYNLEILCNELITTGALGQPIATVMASRNTLDAAMLTYDEGIDRVLLTSTDSRYSSIYRYISYMNQIIDRVYDVEGDDSRRPVLDAEAHIMRAWLHFLAVNIFAAQYDQATAGTTGGIPYCETIDIFEQRTKQSLATVYEKILADCDEKYIEALPDQAANVLRGNKAWGYGVRARVLLQMKRYDEALPLAEKALEYNSTIEDRSATPDLGMWSLLDTAPNNLLFIGTSIATPFMVVISPETAARFEAGDYVMDYTSDWSELYVSMLCGAPAGAKMFFGFLAEVNPWGLTTERVIYTLAECLIRTNRIDEGLAEVDRIRSKRIHPDFYTPFAERGITDEAQAMALLQEAKWVECIGSFENFFDCKRWNSEEKYRKTITRTIPASDTDYDGVPDGETAVFTLAPDSPLWIFPFPNDAVRHNSSLTQNY